MGNMRPNRCANKKGPTSRAGQQLFQGVVLVRKDCQNGRNPFVPVRAAHTEGGGKAEAVRWSDRDGGADRASEKVGGGGLATRKIR